jgi:hypothetical protein
MTLQNDYKDLLYRIGDITRMIFGHQVNVGSEAIAGR